ncbi:MAG: penicillin-binding transpeptidase domain-containing protein [Deltaproteobacteria bacterium]
MAATGLNIKKREFFILLLLTMIVALLILRVAWVQLVQGPQLQKMAIEQQTRDRIVNPKRGTIYDRNKVELAVSISVETVSVIPKEITEPEKVAGKLCEILGLDYNEILKKVTTKTSSIEIIKRKVDREQTDALRKWITQEKIQGVKINEDTKRAYPNNNLASYVIGFTGYDNQGLDGIELMYESVLKGLPGRIVSETDAAGKGMPFERERFYNPQDGTNLVLTIDETIQHIAERYIENAVIDNKCMGGGVAIVMRPKTGEILAMAVKPDFDLNNPFVPNDENLKANWNTFSKEQKSAIMQKMWRNQAVSDTYEPGSTFKIITSAAGLEEGVVTPEDKFTCTGAVNIAGFNLHCWVVGYGRTHGVETFAQGIGNSCNPVFMEVGRRLGKERLYKYINGFGLRDKTGITLPGEAKGIFHNVDKVGPLELATIAFGQRIKVTPVELITAVSAVANGGKLMKPQLIKEMRDRDDNIIQAFEPQVVRQVVSKETSSKLCEMLAGVVAWGTGKGAAVKGYRVAGKTGTADQGINTGVYVASFMAFAPADNPEVAVLIVLNDPKGPDGHMGGRIASPVVGKILGDVLPYLKVEPRYSPDEVVYKETKVPEIRGKKLKEAKEILKSVGLESRVIGQKPNDEDLVTQQSPKPDVIVTTNSQVILFTKKGSNILEVTVPDLKGKTVIQATKILKDIGLNIKVEGNGDMISQEPAAGAIVSIGSEVKVKLGLIEVE